MALAENAAQNAGLGPIHARLLASSAKIHLFEPGDVIARRGDKLTHWTYLASGVVIGSVMLDDASVNTTMIFGESWWLGEYTILSGRPLPSDWIAMTTVTVMSVDADMYLRLLQEAPGFALMRLRQISAMMQWSSDAMVVYKVGGPFFKAVYILSILCETILATRPMDPSDGAESSITIPVSQDMLAKLSGVSRSLLSSYLKILQRNGLVDLSYKNFRLLKAQAWSRWIGSLRHQRILPAVSMTPDMFAQELSRMEASL
jgi:CRP-like cAMP-binding protein